MLRRRDMLLGSTAALAAAACSGRRSGPASSAPRPVGARTIRHDPAAPTAMLGAHCDDLPFHCWHYLTTVRPLVCVDMFMAVPPAGTTATDARMGTYDAVEYMKVRRAEEKEVLARAGAVPPVFLSGLDMPYRSQEPPNLDVLAGELIDAVPVASRMVAPLGLGNRIRVGTPTYSHVDHKLVRDVADSFPHVPKTYYAEIYALSKKSSDYGELIEHMRAYRHWSLTRIDLTPAQLKAKRAALELYRSQLAGLLADVPDILSDGVLSTELYWTPA